MGKTYEQIIDRFDGGISEDKRSKASNKFSITKHFDAQTFPHKLVPHIKTEAVENKTYDITKFLNSIKRNGTTEYIYGFGIEVGSGKAKVYRMLVNGTTWASGANNTSGLAKKDGVFFEYKGYIYMYFGSGGTSRLIRYDTSGASAFEDNVIANVFSKTAISFTTVVQPVHHPADDIAYFFYDNKVHALNDTVWSDPADLILPDNLKIVDACAYGNYLAIACVTKSIANPKSIVYLWDRDSSLATLTERLDFDTGKILFIANLNNKLIAVMDVGSNNIMSLDKIKYLIKQAQGQFGVTINELVADEILGQQSTEFSKVVDGDRLYFARQIPLNGDVRNGIWVVDSNGNISLDTIEEEILTATNKRIDGILKTLSTWWISHSADGSVNRSDLNKAYSTTLPSTYESLIVNGDKKHRAMKKKLISVGVMTEPMPTAGKIVLSYRKDEDLDGSYTTVYTDTTNDQTYHEAINIESTGADLEQGIEFQFLAESTGGAVIIGIKYKYELVNDELTD